MAVRTQRTKRVINSTRSRALRVAEKCSRATQQLCSQGAALLSGIIVYLLVIGLYALADPESIVKGIFVKIIVIYYLFKGMLAANKFKKKYKNKDILDAA